MWRWEPGCAPGSGRDVEPRRAGPASPGAHWKAPGSPLAQGAGPSAPERGGLAQPPAGMGRCSRRCPPRRSCGGPAEGGVPLRRSRARLARSPPRSSAQRRSRPRLPAPERALLSPPFPSLLYLSLPCPPAPSPHGRSRPRSYERRQQVPALRMRVRPAVSAPPPPERAPRFPRAPQAPQAGTVPLRPG